MRELGPEARGLLALDAEQGGPTETQAARVRRAVLAEIATAAAAGVVVGLAQKTASVTGAGAGSAALGASGLLKLGITLVVGITLGTGATTAYFRASTRSSLASLSSEHPGSPTSIPLGIAQVPTATRPVQVPTAARPVQVPTAARPVQVPPVAAPSTPGPTSASASELAPAGTTSPFARVSPLQKDRPRSAQTPIAATTSEPSAARVATPVDTTAPELALLREARVALRDGDAPRALSVLDALALRFPSGTLSEERDALRVEALCASHRSGEAAADRDAFTRRYPTSPLGPAVRRTCPSP